MRDNIDVFFMKQAYLYSERSTCIRRKVGCVITRDKYLLSAGYNGAVRGMEHCAEQTCIRNIMKIKSGERQELCRGSHSEINAIAQAARNGININGATLYCTTKPCLYCAKAIISAGITKLIYRETYDDTNSDLVNEILNGITVEIIKI